MLNSYERIVASCLNGGFLSVVIAWHKAAFNKTGFVEWETMMIVAGLCWMTAAAAMLWYKRSAILQQEVRGFPPVYYFILVVPLCIYAFIMPWALLHVLGLIIPVPTV
jgi:magnesium-transporting ATPase (P-type)